MVKQNLFAVNAEEFLKRRYDKIKGFITNLTNKLIISN